MELTANTLESLARRVVGLDGPGRPAPTAAKGEAAGVGPVDVLDDADTLARARRGRADALAALVAGLQDTWYRYTLSLLRDPDQARDATQEAALRFVRDLGAFRGDSTLRTWALGIATNVCRERRRRRTMATLPDQQTATDAAPGPEQQAEHAEQRDRLVAVLRGLPPRQHEAVVLRFFEQLSVRETAVAMGCAEGTVKATLSQALRSLRDRLGVDDD